MKLIFFVKIRLYWLAKTKISDTNITVELSSVSKQIFQLICAARVDASYECKVTFVENQKLTRASNVSSKTGPHSYQKSEYDL